MADVSEVGPGDKVKVKGKLYTIAKIEHDQYDERRKIGKSWTVTTKEGETFNMFQIERYIKAT